MNTNSFPLLRVTMQGFRDLWAARHLWSVLFIAPIVVGFAAMLASEFFSILDKPLLMSVVKVPEDLIKGAMCAVFARYLVFKETPENIVQNKVAQLYVVRAALLYTALNFILAGVLAMATMFMPDNPQEANPAFLVSSLVGSVVMIWMFRFQWLPIGTAIHIPPRDFARSLLAGGILLSLRIFLLWMLIAVPALCFIGLTSEIILNLAHSTDIHTLTGPYLWALLLCNVLAGLLTVFWQMTASLRAIQCCLQHPGQS